MMTKWKLTKLAEIAEVRAGSPAPQGAEFFDSNGVPFVRVQDVGRYRRTTCLTETKDRINQHAIETLRPVFAKAGTIVFPKSGAAINTNSRAILGTNAYVVSHLAMVTAIEEIALPEWLYFWLCSFNLTSLSRTTSLPSVRLSDIKELKIPLPPMAEQHRIVARIKECMDRIEEIEALRVETIADSKKLQSAVFADYIESLSDTELGISLLGDVVAECKYGTSKKANTTGKGCPVLRMGNIRFGKLDTSDLKHIDLPKLERKKYLLQDGDILINRTNSLELVGKSAVFSGLLGDWVYASYLIRLRIDPKKALPQYVNAVINSRIGRNYVFRTARRAIGMVNINAKEIQRMPMPLPSIEEQAILIDKMNEAEPLIDDLVSVFQEDGLTHLLESILRKAFSGEL